VCLDHFYLSLFRSSLILAAILAEHVSRFAALLDDRVQNLQLFGLVKLLHNIDFVLHQRGFEHSDRTQARLLLRLHGFHHVLLQSFEKRHSILYSISFSTTTLLPVSLMHIKKQRLLTPGPTPLLPRALHAMMASDVHHRTQDFQRIYKQVLIDLKEVYGTTNDVLPLVSSGSGAMEASVSNLFRRGDKVIVCTAGKFGERWVAMTKAFG